MKRHETVREYVTHVPARQRTRGSDDHKVEAVVLFVHDLAGSTAFYRDTFKLAFQGSDADSATFRLQDGLYLILLAPSGTKDLLGAGVNESQPLEGRAGYLP